MNLSPELFDPDLWPSKYKLAKAALKEISARLWDDWDTLTQEERERLLDRELHAKAQLTEEDELVPPF